MVETEFVYKVIKLHDKYTKCVGKCFQGHSMFQKALKEVFDDVCNKDVHKSIANLFSMFCANVRRKAVDEPTTEDILEKAVKLLTYMDKDNKDLFLQFHRKMLEMRSPIDTKVEIGFLL